MKLLHDEGIEVKSHMSSVGPAVEKKIQKLLGSKKPDKKEKGGWEEEKRQSIRSVLDKELDKEEKDGRMKVKEYFQEKEAGQT
ncbi:MAG: hypothetical protein U5N58_10305 [Actinomycetota bacterium]|nr:hypothetical protein [Actinomycetota bacterium]